MAHDSCLSIHLFRVLKKDYAYNQFVFRFHSTFRRTMVGMFMTGRCDDVMNMTGSWPAAFCQLKSSKVPSFTHTIRKQNHEQLAVYSN